MSAALSWTMLLCAGLLEIVFAVGLKSAQGLSRPWVAAVTLAALVGSLVLLYSALRVLPVGTAYAVWTGIGAAGTALVGVLFLGDAASAARLGCIALIIAGVIGLRMVH